MILRKPNLSNEKITKQIEIVKKKRKLDRNFNNIVQNNKRQQIEELKRDTKYKPNAETSG